MPWHNKTMKDVAACDKLRWGGKQPLTRRFPNGETYLDEVEMPRALAWGEDPVNWNILVAGGKEINTTYFTLTAKDRKIIFVSV